jgi:hypothetical protein
MRTAGMAFEVRRAAGGVPRPAWSASRLNAAIRPSSWSGTRPTSPMCTRRRRSCPPRPGHDLRRSCRGAAIRGGRGHNRGRRRSGQRRPAQGHRRPGCLRADGRCRRAGQGPQVRAGLPDGSRPAARPGSDQVWAAYIAAKTAADADLRARDLDWTILRPGGQPMPRPPEGSSSRPRRPPPARSCAPTSPPSSPPCSTIRIPGIRLLNWSAETPRSPPPRTAFLSCTEDAPDVASADERV